MSIYQVINILYARIWVIILTIVITVSTTVAVVMILSEQYTASSTVILDIAVPDAVSGRTMPSGLVRDHIRTQIRLIKSDRVALKVVDSLNLTQSQTYLNLFSGEDNPNINFRNWVALEIIKNLEVKQVAGSRILAISFTSRNARFSATAANAFTEAYIAVDLELRVDPAKRNAQWFSGQLNNLQQNLDDAQRRLTEYQQKTGIVSISESLDAETAKLADLTTRVTAAEADVSNAKSLVKQLSTYQAVKESGAVLPEFLSNSNIQRWRDELTKIDAQFAMVSGSVGPNHPTYKAVQAQREVIQKQLDSEIGKLRESIFAQVEMAESKADSLNEELVSQKNKLLRLRGERDVLDSLLREVEIRIMEYDDAFRRAGTLRLEGAVAQSSVVIMSEALVPMEHSFPKRTLSVAMAAAASFMLGIALAFLLEMIDRRIRSVQDLEQSSGVVVYTSLKRIKKKTKSARPKTVSNKKSQTPSQMAAQ